MTRKEVEELDYEMRKLLEKAQANIREDNARKPQIKNSHQRLLALSQFDYFVAKARRRSSNIVLAGKPMLHAYVLKSSNFFPFLTALFCISRMLSPTMAYVDAYPGPFPWCAGNSWW